MINIRELRIGNIVADEKGGKSVVSGLQDCRIAVKPYASYPEYPAESIEMKVFGIPLTERFLLKCEFEKVMQRQLFGFLGVDFYQKIYKIEAAECPLIMIKENGTMHHVVPSDGKFGCSFVPILYIHQLQNLYFELTRKEIEVKLD